MIHRRGALAMLALASLTACGTTVPQQHTISGGAGQAQVSTDGSVEPGPSADNTAAPPADPSGPASERVGAVSGTSPVGPTHLGSTLTAAPATGARRSTARPTAASRSTAPVPSTRAGITSTTISVGITFVSNSDALNSAAGANNVASGDVEAQYRSVIAYYNSHGGFGGRTLVPDFFEESATSTQTIAQQQAAACAHYTQDHHDFLVFGIGGASYRGCLAKGGAILIDSNFPQLGAGDLTSTVFELGSPSFDRIAAYLPTDLKAQGYFQPWNTATGAPATAGTGTVKVGIVSYSGDPFEHAITTFLGPALKSMGYATDVRYVDPPSSASDEGSVAATVSSAELSFASEMVDHVIVFDVNGALTLFFAEAASTQGYHPRYGGSTANSFETTIDTGATPKDQFNGAMGFSWFSLDDLPASQDPDDGPYSNPIRRSCVAIYTAAGYAPVSRDDERGQIAFCDILTMVRQSVTAAARKGALTTASFVAGAESLGSGYTTGLTFGGSLGPGHHDAPTGAHDEQYSAGCGCMTYVGGVKTIP